MSIEDQIEAYITAQAEPKRSDMRALHEIILGLMPQCKLWFLDGKDETGKVVSNPNVGYGSRIIKYAKGDTREFYQIGISANTAGISVYVLGIEDKGHLARTYGQVIGKASVTGYCIKLKALKDVDVDVLVAAMRDGISRGIAAGPSAPSSAAPE